MDRGISILSTQIIKSTCYRKRACSKFDRTKYSDGIPIDTYKKDVDSIVKRKLSYDWTTLRNSIKQQGLRHSTLSAQMPAESSSVVCNETNAIEPPRDYLVR